MCIAMSFLSPAEKMSWLTYVRQLRLYRGVLLYVSRVDSHRQLQRFSLVRPRGSSLSMCKYQLSTVYISYLSERLFANHS